MTPSVSAEQAAQAKAYAHQHVLEPLRPALIGVSLAHLALAALIAWLTWGSGDAKNNPSSRLQPAATALTSLQWFRPADFQSALPIPPFPNENTQPNTATPASSASDLRNTSRYITFSRIQSAPADPPELTPNPNLSAAAPKPTLDAATLDQLDRIDEALYDTFMQVWSPPSPERLSPTKRTARLDISLTPELTLEHADLVVPSGSIDLDLSITLAAEKVAERLRTRFTTADSLKFPQTLPSTFQNSRYVCRIQFQIE